MKKENLLKRKIGCPCFIINRTFSRITIKTCKKHFVLKCYHKEYNKGNHFLFTTKILNQHVSTTKA